MSTTELRVAVVGAGRWAERAHIPGCGQRVPRVEVAAVVDVSAEAAGRAAKEFGVARAETDYRAVLDDPSIDVVDAATGNEAHFEISWAAIEAGQHVLCEKPVHRDARQTSGSIRPRRCAGPKGRRRALRRSACRPSRATAPR